MLSTVTAAIASEAAVVAAAVLLVVIVEADQELQELHVGDFIGVGIQLSVQVLMIVLMVIVSRGLVLMCVVLMLVHLVWPPVRRGMKKHHNVQNRLRTRTL